MTIGTKNNKQKFINNDTIIQMYYGIQNHFHYSTNLLKHENSNVLWISKHKLSNLSDNSNVLWVIHFVLLKVQPKQMEMENGDR